MAQREEQHHSTPREVPPVSRPRGAVWRSLQADGVVWEGQVLLVGDDVDLAARMVVTHRRVAFVRGGDIVLEIPRGWMRQEPVLRRDGILELFVATPGGSIFDEPTSVPIRMREGHPAAGHIIAMLAPGGARRIAPDALSGMERAREAAPAPTFGGFWDAIEPERADNVSTEADEPSRTMHESPLVAPEPRDRVIRVPSTPPRLSAASGFPISGIAPRDQRRSPWGLFLRIGALVVLLATAAALGAGRLHLSLPGRTPGAVLAAPTPTTQAPAVGESPAAALTAEELTAVALGVGGGAEEEPDQTMAAAAQAPTATPAPPVAAATAPPAATAVATTPPIPTPAAAVATPLPTATPAPLTAPSISTPEPTPAAPASAADSAMESSPTADLATAAATPAAAIASQPAAVPADESAAQEIVVDSLRLAFPTALRAETLPRYGLPPGSGDWLLLEAEITNEGDGAASLALPEVRVFDRGSGQVYDLDGGTGVIASLAGFDPAFEPDDVITLDAGAAVRALLLYLLPPGSGDDLALIVGQSSLDISPILNAGDAVVAARPELVAATVTGVPSGDAIVVDVGGAEFEVRYLGFRAPDAGACFAAEAAAANGQLVDGKEVWLERQATDLSEGVAVRDVWIATPDGGRALVSARLLEAGAGVAAPVPPDTRYQAWLAAAQALGRTNGAGLWSACPPG